MTERQLVERFKSSAAITGRSVDDDMLDELFARLSELRNRWNDDDYVDRDENIAMGHFPVVVHIVKSSALVQPDLKSIPLTVRVLHLNSLSVHCFDPLVSNLNVSSPFSHILRISKICRSGTMSQLASPSFKTSMPCALLTLR